MVNEWEENIHFKVLHSRVIDFSSIGPMSHSSCRFLVSRSLNQQNLLTPQFSPISYEKYLSSLRSLVTFLQVFASIHAFTISQSACCKAWDMSLVYFRMCCVTTRATMNWELESLSDLSLNISLKYCFTHLYLEIKIISCQPSQSTVLHIAWKPIVFANILNQCVT